MNAEGNSLTRTAIDLQPPRFFATAGCHFAADAAEDISSDPVLGPVFARHAPWLVSTPGNESIDAARDWNRRFPDAQVEIIHDRGEWSILPTCSIPKFHIVRGGKVMATGQGCRREPTATRHPLLTSDKCL